ncbi:MAG: flagellar filament capping protein FliD [Acidobacteriota bacterium]
MSLSPLTITGVSQFSTDLQTILDRAVKIAQIPITALQNRDSDTLQKKTLLGGLSGGVSNFASTIEALADTARKKALTATSSNSSVVSVTASGATSAVSYTIDSVTSIAKAAAERTSTSYLDSAATPVGSTGAFRLKVGTDNFDFTLANNTLVGLRDKINGLGAGVTASILTTSGGNYLSISSNTTGAKTLALQDDPLGANTNLLTATNQGSDLEFHLNGIQVKQSRNLVNNVVPGLSFTVLAPSADPVEVSISSDRSALSSALSGFVSGFNTLRTQVNAQTGAAAGLLTGSSVVVQLSARLREIASHRSTSGSIRGLADLGITFDTKGQATFDQNAVSNLTEDQLADAFTFVGNTTSGLGKSAAGLRQFSDPLNGLIILDQRGLDRVDQALQRQIDTLNTRLSVMQQGLALKLQKADALLASLSSQQNQITASIQGLNSVLYGRSSA